MNFTIPARWAALLLALPVTLAVARGVRDLDDYSTATRDLEEATTATAEFDNESAQMSGRIEAKLAVVEEYTAGRITLRAAARRFLALSDGERALTTLRRMWPGATDDEERCAASVVQYVRAAADTHQPTTPAYRRVVAEFTREYGDSVTLPTLP